MEKIELSHNVNSPADGSLQEKYAIEIQHVSKVYKLYDHNKDRVLDALGLTKKKRYHEHHALADVNFRVKRGETVGIIGTNGAGKSTILKIITGVLNPSSGEVQIDGRISALLELGAGFNQEYTGIENIYLNGTMMGFSREEIDRRMDAILDFADIGDFVNQPVKTYSSGMFVRLAFAVAINIDPEILVVDEALSVGDVFFQNKCYMKFEEFKQEGKTILFVSHDLNSISKYCDRVILLNKGSKLAEGTPKDMINLYKKLLTGSKEDVESVEKEQQEHADDISQMLTGDEKGIRSNKFNRMDDGSTPWKNSFTINPDLIEYGSKVAEIVDFAIIDENEQLTNTLIKGTRFRIKSKVFFHEDVKNPIFTFTFKTIRGVDITGTNTMFENKDIPLAKAGETYIAAFEQEMNLQGGEYLLSLSCTGYQNGELTAYHRCYDLVGVTVISDKNTAGFYDMNSQVTIEKL